LLANDNENHMLMLINCWILDHVCSRFNTLAPWWFRRFSQKKTAVFGCLTNALAPLLIALESCSTAQTDRPV